MQSFLGNPYDRVEERIPTVGELLEEYSRLEDERIENEKRHDAITARQTEIRPRLQDYFIQHEISEVRILDKPLKLVREIWITKRGGASMQDACDALRTAGLGAYVGESYHPGTVSAHFRELENLLQPGTLVHLPEELEGVFALGEQFSMRRRRPPNKSKKEQPRDGV